MLVLDYDLICAHILLPFVRDTRPQPLLSHFTLHTIHFILYYSIQWSAAAKVWGITLPEHFGYVLLVKRILVLGSETED